MHNFVHSTVTGYNNAVLSSRSSPHGKSRAWVTKWEMKLYILALKRAINGRMPTT